MGRRIAALSLALFAPMAAAADAVGDCPLCPANPMKYMMFASDYHAAKFDASYVENIVTKYGKDVIVGRDQGDGDEKQMVEAIAKAQSLGAQLEIYLEGPGGPTGDKYWSDDEYQRIHDAAKTYCGLDVKGTKSSKGVIIDEKSIKEWDTTCWKTYARVQLVQFAGQGYTNYEIDNLYRAIDSKGRTLDDPDAFVDFLAEQLQWQQSKGLGSLKIVLKNMSQDNLKKLATAIQGGKVPRSMLCDFHIWETDAGSSTDEKEVTKLSAAIGVQTILSHDTYQYKAEGPYTLKQGDADLLV